MFHYGNREAQAFILSAFDLVRGIGVFIILVIHL